MSGMLNMLVGGAPKITVTASGNPTNTSTGSTSNDSVHTITVTGGTATSYTWSVVFGNASVVSGGSTVSATLRVTDTAEGDLNPEIAQFNCAVVVNGVTYNVTVDKTHDWL